MEYGLLVFSIKADHLNKFVYKISHIEVIKLN